MLKNKNISKHANNLPSYQLYTHYDNIIIYDFIFYSVSKLAISIKNTLFFVFKMSDITY